MIMLKERGLLKLKRESGCILIWYSPPNLPKGEELVLSSPPSEGLGEELALGITVESPTLVVTPKEK